MHGKLSRAQRDSLITSARWMRENPTHAEAILWKRLRKKRLGGLKFRRQHIIKAFIVDFCCPRASVVVEVDGSVHDYQSEYDREREKVLSESGYQIIRFLNVEIECSMDIVSACIYDTCMRRIDGE